MPGGLPNKTARALLDIEDKAYVPIIRDPKSTTCLLYTSDAADERSSVDLGGRRIIQKKTTHQNVTAIRHRQTGNHKSDKAHNIYRSPGAQHARNSYE